jgi:teichuronic acid biosynthesis glycosyltransferase TuaG
MNELVTIIMPVYNAALYVGYAIESVLKQTYGNWELLIIDDGSTDGSNEIMKSFTDSRIYLFSQPNRGVSSARNVGLLHRKGQYVCFLDADDAMPPESISERLNLFRKNPNVNMVDGYVEVYDASMTSLIRTWQPSLRGNVTGSLLALKAECFFSLTWMIRIVPDHQYTFDEDLSHTEDLLFLTHLSGKGDYDYVPRPVYQYRVRPGSAMKHLDGLAKGYWQYYHKVCGLYRHQLTERMKMLLLLKIRRLMFLSYLSDRKIFKAFQYLITGRTHRTGKICV